MKDFLIVTRHGALVEFLKGKGIVGQVKEHVQKEDVSGKVVVGMIPLHLASYAECVVEPVFVIPKDKRGKELSVEELSQFFRGFKKYKVILIGSVGDVSKAIDFIVM